jgi:enoyl-CoA hydratase/carnithine racemase
MTIPVLSRREGAVRWLVLDNVAKHNALTLEMNQGLIAAIEAFTAADDEQVLVLSGAGDKAFMSGADISEFEGDEARVAAFGRDTLRMMRSLRDLPKPTVAMIRGYCIGGGLALASACDIRIAAEDASFSIPAARLGVGYSGEFTRLLVDLIGPAFTKEILYTARRYPAAEALAIGLINRLVPVVELEEFTRDYCQGMAENAPLTQRAAKLVVDELVAGTHVEGSPGHQAVAACAESEDFRNAPRAFLEKRKPVFRGR